MLLVEQGEAPDSLLMVSYSWEGFFTTRDRFFFGFELFRLVCETLQTEGRKKDLDYVVLFKPGLCNSYDFQSLPLSGVTGEPART